MTHRGPINLSPDVNGSQIRRASGAVPDTVSGPPKDLRFVNEPLPRAPAVPRRSRVYDSYSVLYEYVTGNAICVVPGTASLLAFKCLVESYRSTLLTLLGFLSA